MHLTIMFVVMRALSLSRARAYSTVSHVGSSLSVTAVRGLPGGQMSEFLAGIACIALHCEMKNPSRESLDDPQRLKTLL